VKESRTQLRYGSVCSGVAPQTRAWKELGLECAWFSEIEPFPSAVLKHHFPEIPNLGDFTQIGTEHGPIDLLVGGTPCQSFSVAGKRAGLDDARGNLTIEFVRLAQRLRPRWLAWENVPGVLSIDGGRTFGTFLGMLGQLGYGFAYRILDAQHFGVPQRRRRLFVVGCLGNWRAAAAVLFERESLSGNPAPSREKGKGTTWSTAPSLTASGRRVERTGESRGQDPVIAIGLDEEQNAVVDGFGCLKSREKGGGFEGVVAHSLRGEGFDASEDGTGRGIPLVARCLSTKNERIDWETETFVPVAFSAKDHGADATDNCSPTLRAGGFDKSHANSGNWMAVAVRTANTNANGFTAIKQGMAVRRLLPVECEALQGFERNYTLIPWRGKTAPDGPRYKSIGNSWAVPVLTWLAKRILAVDRDGVGEQPK
jgi:DNA (cytosine-5)-methyltransferase 1